ncbi:hypothetical protein HDU97_008647 [Phlyctochytrium planicorne]|nr:hypothetical protein HDU97_008647 [Phlyctochytrium planicorne]
MSYASAAPEDPLIQQQHLQQHSNNSINIALAAASASSTATATASSANSLLMVTNPALGGQRMSNFRLGALGGSSLLDFPTGISPSPLPTIDQTPNRFANGSKLEMEPNIFEQSFAGNPSFQFNADTMASPKPVLPPLMNRTSSMYPTSAALTPNTIFMDRLVDFSPFSKIPMASPRTLEKQFAADIYSNPLPPPPLPLPASNQHQKKNGLSAIAPSTNPPETSFAINNTNNSIATTPSTTRDSGSPETRHVSVDSVTTSAPSLASSTTTTTATTTTSTTTTTTSAHPSISVSAGPTANNSPAMSLSHHTNPSTSRANSRANSRASTPSNHDTNAIFISTTDENPMHHNRGFDYHNNPYRNSAVGSSLTSLVSAAAAAAASNPLRDALPMSMRKQQQQQQHQQQQQQQQQHQQRGLPNHGGGRISHDHINVVSVKEPEMVVMHNGLQSMTVPNDIGSNPSSRAPSVEPTFRHLPEDPYGISTRMAKRLQGFVDPRQHQQQQLRQHQSSLMNALNVVSDMGMRMNASAGGFNKRTARIAFEEQTDEGYVNQQDVLLQQQQLHQSQQHEQGYAGLGSMQPPFPVKVEMDDLAQPQQLQQSVVAPTTTRAAKRRGVAASQQQQQQDQLLEQHEQEQKVAVKSKTATPAPSTRGRKKAVSPATTDGPMDEEEKRRIFLERNRQAALKCRQKKKLWLSDLQGKVEMLSTENDDLRDLTSKLREEVLGLKALLLSHRDCEVAVENGLDISAIESTLSTTLRPFSR